MKKLFSMLCACFMLLCLCAPAMAAGVPVIDDAGLFTPAEEAQLEALIETFREKTGMDFGVVTTSSPHEEGRQQAIADALYEQGGYGLGEERSGGLYLIDMYERIPYLCTTGALIDYMTDERIESAHDSNYSDLVRGDFASAAGTMILSVQEYVRRGIPEGQYQYDVITGQRVTARHKALTTGEITLSAGVALAAALIFLGSVKRSYSLKGSTYDYNFRENSDVTLTARTDDYIRTTTTRTRKAPPPSSGSSGGGSRAGRSSIHVSGGGMRHGGGAGRKF